MRWESETHAECTGCRERKAHEAFPLNDDGKRRKRCWDCQKRKVGTRRQRRMRAEQAHPRCTRCGQWKDAGEFVVKPDGRLMKWCRSCLPLRRRSAGRGTEIRCTGCGETKAAELFRWKDEASGRRDTRCFACERVYLRSEKAKESSRRCRRARPEVRRAATRRYRARKRGVPSQRVSVRVVLAKRGGACAYCGKVGVALEVDHVVPLARGGHHVMANLEPACKSCNSSKCARTLAEWTEALRAMGRLREMRGVAFARPKSFGQMELV